MLLHLQRELRIRPVAFAVADHYLWGTALVASMARTPPIALPPNPEKEGHSCVPGEPLLVRCA